MGGDATGDGDDASPLATTASAKGSSSLTTHSGAASSVPPRSLSGSMTGSGETGSEEKATSTLKKPEPTCQQCGGEESMPKGPKATPSTTPTQTRLSRCFVHRRECSPRLAWAGTLPNSAPLTALLDAMPTSPRGTRAPGEPSTTRERKGPAWQSKSKKFHAPLAGPGAEPYASEKQPKVVSASRPAPWWLASCLVSRNLTVGLQNRGNLRNVSGLCTV